MVIKAVLILAFIYGASSIPAAAKEPLNYTNKLTFRAERLLKDYDLNTYDVALADLNQDSVDEYILKSKSCERECHFLILAEKSEAVVNVADIIAFDLVIGDGDFTNVRPLLAYNDPLNDFKYERYLWSAFESRYIPESEHDIVD